MSETLIGYARCSTDQQDLTAERRAVGELGVAPKRMHMNKGLIGSNPPGPVPMRPWLTCARATLWWCPSWTTWPDPFPMPGRSQTSSQPRNTWTAWVYNRWGTSRAVGRKEGAYKIAELRRQSDDDRSQD